MLHLLLAPVAIAAPLGDAPIEVDGKLNEPVWASAPLQRGFVERTPTPRAQPPADTEFRVLYDDAAIYVGVRLKTSPDERPRALELTRDSGRIWSDDAVTLKFDVALDRRSTLGFVTNPAGAQIDFVALDNGASFRREIDSVWQVATRIEHDAWTAEFRIPYPALGLAAAPGARVLGFNVTRDHNGRNATDDWAHLPPEFGAMAATHYGRLEGLRDVGTDGRPLVFIPYALARTPGTDDWSGDDLDVRLGADARMRLGLDTWGEVTVLTDFAEVDLDDRVVNLDRFPLFLPEKRPFFLSGLQVFDFGEAGIAQPFFSRRIGIAGGQPTPVWGGAKLYGRAGDLQFGLLDVVSDHDEVNTGVGRIKHVFGGAGHLGAIVVARDGLSDGPHDYALGADGSLRTLDDRLTLSAYGTGAFGDQAPGSASRLALAYQGERLQPTLSLRHISADFAPSTGFVRRNDLTTASVELPFVTYWQSGALANVRIGLGAETNRSADAADHRASSGSGALDLTWRNGWGANLGATYGEDVVVEAFDVLGQTVAAGDYRSFSTSVGFASPFTRNPAIAAGYTFIDGFFGGTRHRIDGDVSAYFGPHLRAAAGGEYSRVDLPRGPPEDTLALNSKLTVAASPRLFTDFVFQTETATDDAAVFARLRWRYLPGSDVFLVYQHQAPRPALFEGGAHAITLKLTYWADVLL